MFRLILERNFLRVMFAIAVVGFFGVFVFAYQLDKHNRGPKDLRVATLADGKVNVGGSEADALSTQNFSSAELSERLQEIVAETLSFTARDFAQGRASAQKYFSPSGYQQYQDFLTSAGFEETLRGQNLKSGAFMEAPPAELAKGVYDGIFKWVFEVPVTISFIQANADTYRDGEITPVNRRFMLRVQFARIKDPADANAVRIELWQVLPARSN